MSDLAQRLREEAVKYSGYGWTAPDKNTVTPLLREAAGAVDILSELVESVDAEQDPHHWYPHKDILDRARACLADQHLGKQE